MQGMAIFGPAKLREWRNRRGMTQGELAEAIGLRGGKKRHGDISRWERGKKTPSDKNVYRLAEVLGLADTELMVGDEPLPTEQAIMAKATEYLRQLPDHVQLREIARLADLVEQDRRRRRIEQEERQDTSLGPRRTGD